MAIFVQISSNNIKIQEKNTQTTNVQLPVTSNASFSGKAVQHVSVLSKPSKHHLF